MSEQRAINVVGLDHVVLRVHDPDLQLTQMRAGRSLIDMVRVGEDRDLDADVERRANNMDHFCVRIDP